MTLSIMFCTVCLCADVIVVMTSFYAGKGHFDIYNQAYCYSYKS